MTSPPPPPLSEGLDPPLKIRLYIWVGSRRDVYVIDCDIEVYLAMDRCFTFFALVSAIKFRPAAPNKEGNSRYKNTSLCVSLRR